jgi:hypothetical protein
MLLDNLSKAVNKLVTKVYGPKESSPVEVYTPTGLEWREWRWEGRTHRVGKPAIIRYFPNDGPVMAEEWFRQGARHREDGPAVVQYYRDGGISGEEWWVDGLNIREDGPAFVRYSPDGKITKELVSVDAEVSG